MAGENLEAIHSIKTRFDIACTGLRSARQIAELPPVEQKGRPEVTLAISLRAGAKASEWQASKFKANGDEVGALLANVHTVTLRWMAAEAAITEHRQSIHLVPPIDRDREQ